MSLCAHCSSLDRQRAWTAGSACRAARVMLTRMALPSLFRWVAGLLERPAAIRSCGHCSTEGQCLHVHGACSEAHSVLLHWEDGVIQDHVVALVTKTLQQWRLIWQSECFRCIHQADSTARNT